MSNQDLLPRMAEPKPDNLEPVSMTIDSASIAWLDGLATQTNKSRSEVARDIFRKVREATALTAS